MTRIEKINQEIEKAVTQVLEKHGEAKVDTALIDLNREINGVVTFSIKIGDTLVNDLNRIQEILGSN